jgi:Flp pilus assembly secretin CpaC
VPQLPVQTAETEGPLSVYVDRAEILPIPKNLGSVVVGNPLIADASIHPGGFMVITPKGLGTTNLILLDMKGNTLAYRLIKVKTVSEQTVRVFRGLERETYNCAPHCDKTQTLGDNSPYFDANMGQSASRSNTLSGMARQ